MKRIEDYLSIRHLDGEPLSMEGRQVGFSRGDKGETAYLNINAGSQTVMVIELLAGKLRGGHSHIEKDEWLYMIEGEAIAYFWMPESPHEVKAVNLTKTDLVCIKPGLAHAYIGAPRAIALEQAELPYNKAHTLIAEALPPVLQSFMNK